jgi:intracellular sulfur oxidation DsrE/DsrF family protein
MSGSKANQAGSKANQAGRGTSALPKLEKALCIEREKKLDPAFSLISTSGNPGRAVVVISDDKLGTEDSEHGKELMLAFLRGLCDRATLPDEIVFYHRGVLVLDIEHPADSLLRNLCAQDVEMKACRESLNFYKKEPAVLKIQPVPMSEITHDLLMADRVIHP